LIRGRLESEHEQEAITRVINFNFPYKIEGE
jgi:hypothetical protein